MNASSKSHQSFILVLISLAAFMGALDCTIVNISLPTISKYFHCDVATVSWVAMSYLLIVSSMLITFGRVADIRGYKKIYLAGFAIFTVGSLLCGLSSNIYLLIGFRVFQAIGAAMLQAIGAAMVVRYLPEKVRGTAIGIITTFAAVGLAAGTPLGGFLVQFYSWHWIFFINVPVGIIAIIMALVIVPRDIKETVEAKFDMPGAGLLFIALGSLIFYLNMGNNVGWLSWLMFLIIGVSLATWVGFVLNERRGGSPLINLRLFRDKNFAIAVLVSVMVMLIAQGSWYAFPFYLELEKGLATNVAGLVLLIPTIAMMIFGPVAGFFSDRIGSRPICIIASVLLAAAFLLFALMGTETGLRYIIIALVLEGIGVGLMLPANLNLIMSSSPKGEEGVINSLVNTARNTGAVTGIAIFTLIFLSVIASRGISPSGITAASLPPSDFTAGFHVIFFFGTGLGLVMLVLNWVLGEKRRGTTKT